MAPDDYRNLFRSRLVNYSRKAASAAAGSSRPSYSARPMIMPSRPVPGAALSQRHHVRESGNPAGGDHRRREAAGQGGGCLQVQAGQHAVAADIGVDDRRGAAILEPQRQLGCIQVRLFGPPVGGGAAPARIDADRDAAGKRPAGLLHQRRRLHRRAAQHNAAHPSGKPGFQAGHIADAAAELHRDDDGGEDVAAPPPR